MSGADLDYSFESKRIWRTQVWKELTKRLTVEPKDAIVLYLAGWSDLDRGIALRLGFHPYNLIAVESNRKVCKALRKNGVRTIYGDYLETLISWPHDLPLSIVFGDFCSGLEQKILSEVTKSLVLPATFGAAFAFNLLRGRDPSTTRWRTEISEAIGAEDLKHRGNFLAANIHMFMCSIFAWRQMGLQMFTPTSDMTWAQQQRYADLVSHASATGYASGLKFKFSTYKSEAGSQRFDSVIFSSPMPRGDARDLRNSESMRRLRESTSEYRRKRIAPVLAHRTMQMQGNQ
jgi:hypothetical protein